MAETLSVWLGGIEVATIFQNRRQLRLQYTLEALAHYDPGSPILSRGLPLRSAVYTHLPVQAFLEGLLPEGEPRTAVARETRLRQDDTFGLIRALGRDCAGALVIQPSEEAPPPQGSNRAATPLSALDLTRLLENLPVAPLGLTGERRFSLAGAQEKLLLTRLPDGGWGHPGDGAPSTHILKPEMGRFPDTVANEAFCMRLAQALGLPVANVETAEIGGRRVLVVERFDRKVEADGAITRLHQEDFCQATSMPPERKYEQHGGPSLRDIAAIVQTVTPAGTVDTLLRAATLNVLLGNCDAHAKNFSLLHRLPRLEFAPLYDLLSTTYYSNLDQTMAMFIDNVRQVGQVTVGRILREAIRWEMNARRAETIVGEIIEALPGAIDEAARQTRPLPDRLPELVLEQWKRLKDSVA